MLRGVDFDDSLLVHSRFGLHDFESDVNDGDRGVMTSEALCFLVDKRGETLCDFEMDCLNSYFQGDPPFYCARGCAS